MPITLTAIENNIAKHAIIVAFPIPYFKTPTIIIANPPTDEIIGINLLLFLVNKL